MNTQIITETSAQVPAVLTNCVTQGVNESFDKICAPHSACSIKNASECDHDGAVGIISFIGDVNCSVILGLPHKSVEKIAKQFCGFEVPMDSPDMGDVIGELANVVAGAINGKLESENINTQISLPSVARGSDVEMLLPHNLPSEQISFTTLGCDFWVKVVVAK